MAWKHLDPTFGVSQKGNIDISGQGIDTILTEYPGLRTHGLNILI